MIKLLREFIMGLSENPEREVPEKYCPPRNYGRRSVEKSKQHFGDSPASGNEL